MMSTTAPKPATTPIPVQLSEPEFEAFILPHLSMPKRGPKCKLGYYRVSWLRVFQRGNAAHLPHGVGQEREATLLQSEKYVARCGSKYDEMCMITASFVRMLQRCTGSLCMHFLLIFQEVRSVSKTRNQLYVRPACRGIYKRRRA